MIDKLDLVSIISKYHLNGVVEQVRWDIKNNKLGIGFNSPDKGLLGSIEYNEFPVEDSTIAIGSTSQLVKLIGITNGYLNIEYTKRHKLITQMIIADNQYTLNYALADTNHIPSSGQLAGEFEYTATAEIDNESIAAIVKAKQELGLMIGPEIKIVLMMIMKIGLSYVLEEIYNILIKYHFSCKMLI